MKNNRIETINANAKALLKEIDDLAVNLKIHMPPSRQSKVTDHQLRLFKEYYCELLKDVNTYSKISWLWIPFYGKPYQQALEKMQFYEAKTKQQLEKIKGAVDKLINLEKNLTKSE